jgi:hypothetical protein
VAGSGTLEKTLVRTVYEPESPYADNGAYVLMSAD